MPWITIGFLQQTVGTTHQRCQRARRARETGAGCAHTHTHTHAHAPFEAGVRVPLARALAPVPPRGVHEVPVHHVHLHRLRRAREPAPGVRAAAAPRRVPVRLRLLLVMLLLVLLASLSRAPSAPTASRTARARTRTRRPWRAERRRRTLLGVPLPIRTRTRACAPRCVILRIRLRIMRRLVLGLRLVLRLVLRGAVGVRERAGQRLRERGGVILSLLLWTLLLLLLRMRRRGRCILGKVRARGQAVGVVSGEHRARIAQNGRRTVQVDGDVTRCTRDRTGCRRRTHERTTPNSNATRTNTHALPRACFSNGLGPGLQRKSKKKIESHQDEATNLSYYVPVHTYTTQRFTFLISAHTSALQHCLGPAHPRGAEEVYAYFYRVRLCSSTNCTKAVR